MPMQKYEPAEKLRVTMNATVVFQTGANLVVEDSDGQHVSIPLGEPGTVIDRLVPAQGMPRPGELWTDREGDIWFAVTDGDGDVAMVCGNKAYYGGFRRTAATWVNQEYGPLALMYRPEIKPEGSDADGDGGEGSVSAPVITPQMVLRRAAEIITANGWNQGDFYDKAQAQAQTLGIEPEKCRVCAVGAILLAAGVDVRRPVPELDLSTPMDVQASEAIRMLGLHLGVYTPGIELEAAAEMADDAIGLWNDTPGRTKEQVCAALEACADDAEAREA